METIKNYLNNIFKRVPGTPEVLRLRAEISANMEEKYEELKRSGKSEHEAIGIVISEFGNIDELLGELGMEKGTQSQAAQSGHADRSSRNAYGHNQNADSGTAGYQQAGYDRETMAREVSQEYAVEYLTAAKKTSVMIGTGVFFILLGVSVMLGLTGVFEWYDFEESLLATLPLAVLFIMISIAVGIFIYVGHRMEEYEFIEKGGFYLMESAQVYVEQERNRFRSKGLAGIITGVCMCIVSPLIIITGFGIADYASTVPLCVMLLVIGVAVFLFIYFGGIISSYEKLLRIKEYSPLKKQQNKIPGVIASIIFPLATAIFLFWGLVYGDWHICWVVFPVAGILYGIFCSVYEALRS